VDRRRKMLAWRELAPEDVGEAPELAPWRGAANSVRCWNSDVGEARQTPPWPALQSI
jgi:hypothetical protein